MARYASALAQAGLFIWVGGRTRGTGHVDNQYWPFATLAELIAMCTACDSGLAAPFTSWLWSQPLWLLVACTGLALMLLGMALRPEA